MKPKTVRQVFLIGFVAAILIGLFGAASESKVSILIMVLLCFGLVIFQIMFHRCPHCGQYLGRNDGKFCQHCGKPLDED